MRKVQRSILKARDVVNAEKASMIETMKNVDNSIAAHDLAINDIEDEIKELQSIKADSIKMKVEAIEYRNKLAEIVGE